MAKTTPNTVNLLEDNGTRSQLYEEPPDALVKVPTFLDSKSIPDQNSAYNRFQPKSGSRLLQSSPR